MPNISKEQRINIVKGVYNTPPFLGDLRGEETGILEFLDKLWPLRAMPSTDQRYSNARDDVWQHMVRNEDWDETSGGQELLYTFSAQYIPSKIVV